MLKKNLTLLYLVYLTRAGTFLILIPYLAFTLSPEIWGKVAMLLSFMQISITALEFGFGIAGTKSVSEIRSQPSLLFGYLSSALIIQSLIFFLVWGISYSLFRFEYIESFLTFLFLLFSIFFQGLTPLWFLRGVEDLFYVSIFEILGKLFILSFVYLLVNRDQDVIYIFLAFLVGSLFPFVSCFIVARRYVKFNNNLVSSLMVKNVFWDSFPFFVMKFGAILVTAGNSFFLGLFNYSVAAGYFAIVEKLVNGFKNLMLPAWEVIFPRLVLLFKQNKKEALKLKKQTYIIMISISATMSLSLFFLAEFLLVFFVNDNILIHTIPIMKVLCLIPFFSALGNAFGMNYLVLHNKANQFVFSVLFGSIINLTLLIILLEVGLFEAENVAAFSAIIGHFSIAILILYFARRVMIDDKYR